MNNKVNSINTHRCNICNKNYSSKSSLCNHNKKFHDNKHNNNNNNSTFLPHKNTITSHITTLNKNECKYCNKKFNIKGNLKRHMSISCSERKKLYLERDFLYKEKEELYKDNISDLLISFNVSANEYFLN